MYIYVKFDKKSVKDKWLCNQKIACTPKKPWHVNMQPVPQVFHETQQNAQKMQRHREYILKRGMKWMRGEDGKVKNQTTLRDALQGRSPKTTSN